MKIKHKITGTVLIEVRNANLRNADLGGADLGNAYLGGADLRNADLRNANLGGADLRNADLGNAYLGNADLRNADLGNAYLGNADLRNADLGNAYLGGADLRNADLRNADLGNAYLGNAYLGNADLGGAKGINKFLTTPLYILQDQIGKIRAYKLTKSDGTGPYYTSNPYEIGETYTEKNADCDENKHCAEGISLATLDWCIREWKEGYRIFVAEFTAKDIACIPIYSDGKFRVKKCKIVAEKDLKELGVK